MPGMHGRIQEVRTPVPAESALFPAESALFPAESALFPAESALFLEESNFQTKIFPRKGTRSLHKTKQIFPRKKPVPRCQENEY
jgi:hypothetical protein